MLTVSQKSVLLSLRDVLNKMQGMPVPTAGCWDERNDTSPLLDIWHEMTSASFRVTCSQDGCVLFCLVDTFPRTGGCYE